MFSPHQVALCVFTNHKSGLHSSVLSPPLLCTRGITDPSHHHFSQGISSVESRSNHPQVANAFIASHYTRSQGQQAGGLPSWMLACLLLQLHRSSRQSAAALQVALLAVQPVCQYSSMVDRSSLSPRGAQVQGMQLLGQLQH